MALMLDQSVDEAAARSWASKGLPRERRFREGVLRASATGRRALVALGWPAIHDRDWQGADGQVALVRDLTAPIPVGLETGGAIDTNGADRDHWRVGPCSSSRDRAEPSGASAVTVLVETMKRR
jgi:hypothetical protein